MSRPYVNINSASYNVTTDVVSFDITALRMRGQTSLTVGGFTQSLTIPLTDGRYITSEGSFFTFSANVNGVTASGNPADATYTPATATFTFAGTASGGATKTNVKITLWGLNGSLVGNFVVLGAGGYTFSATQSTNDAVQTLYTQASSGLLPDGVSVTASGANLIFTATPNTGAFYNGNFAKVETSNLGSLGFTFSSDYLTGTWSGGVTTLSIPVSSSDFGSLETITFDIS